MIHEVKGIMCRICFSLLYEDRQTCSCNNVAIRYDDDGTLYLYTNIITTTQRISVLLNDKKYVSHELLPSFQLALYADYSNIRNTPYYFRDPHPKHATSPSNTRFDRELIAALEKYRYVTSDGKEKFLRTFRRNPKKR